MHMDGTMRFMCIKFSSLLTSFSSYLILNSYIILHRRKFIIPWNEICIDFNILLLKEIIFISFECQ